MTRFAFTESLRISISKEMKREIVARAIRIGASEAFVAREALKRYFAETKRRN